MKTLKITNEKIKEIVIVQSDIIYINFLNQADASRCFTRLSDLEISSRLDGGKSLDYQVFWPESRKGYQIGVRGNLDAALVLLRCLKQLGQENYTQFEVMRKELSKEKSKGEWTFKSGLSLFNQKSEGRSSITQPLIQQSGNGYA